MENTCEPGYKTKQVISFLLSVGTPQGGPLSPLFSNIILDKFDKELEKKGLPFVRYADDVIILARSMSEGLQILSEVTDYLEGKLKLKVNKEKSTVTEIKDSVYLGFTYKRY